MPIDPATGIATPYVYGAANTNAAAEGPAMFGEDGLTFWDLLDVINPLQHIPIVSTLYRAVTGDEIDPAARLAGGALFGGPVGLGAAVANVMLESATGKDAGEHVLAFVDGDPAGSGAPSLPTQADAQAVQQTYEAALTRWELETGIRGATSIRYDV